MAISFGAGSAFKVNTKTVAHCTSIGTPSVTTDMVECTALDSPGGFKEFMAGWKEGGEVTIEGYFDAADAGQQELQKVQDDGTKAAFQLVFPATIGKTWAYNGYVTAFSQTVATADIIGFSATIKVDGKPTLAATEG